MISFSMIPSSISGTNAGHAVSKIFSSGLRAWIAFLYAPLLIVTFVPMIPILLPALQLPATALAAGSMIPRMGIWGNLLRRSSTHVALTVLQAITIIFTSLFTRKSAISMEKLRIVLAAFDPYGVLAVSPKYMILSPRADHASYAGCMSTPPSPESKKPIGLLSILCRNPPKHVAVRIVI